MVWFMIDAACAAGLPVRLISCALLWALLTPNVGVHDGPDPLCHWLCTKSRLRDGELRARLGPDAKVEGAPKVLKDEHGETFLLDGKSDGFFVGDDLDKLDKYLPKNMMTVAAWVAVDTPRQWGGILSCVQDNGKEEAGFVLGYNERRFYFGLATAGADDGDGHMTYLAGTKDYELGRMYHVVATYDGETMSLYVNGALESTSAEQSGAVLYPEKAPVVIGAYRDKDENHRHHGRIREVALYDLCAKAKWVAHEFSHASALAKAAPVRNWPDEHEFVVSPYLQFVTQDGMTVMWETTRPSSSVVFYGETAEVPERVEGREATTMHEVRIPDLDPAKGYFYRIESVDDRGEKLTNEVGTFQTAVTEDMAFAFAVISDTQSNPAVARAISGHAWGQRPHFLLHPGDLVGTGPNKEHWTKQFFPSMKTLVARVAFFPVLGNHEQNARYYFDYVSLPDPEFYYTFEYGNAQFFMIDSNREVGPGSDQYKWLEEQLGKSKAVWKFVCYHHPAYSSDENDYGDMWKGKSTHGDLRVRSLVPLYDRHDVDIVWNGHIHSYERTWPLRAGRPDPEGTTYMITGGGGGGLETPGPIRPWFQNTVRRGHHYCMVRISGRVLEFQAYDLDNRMFDSLRVEKQP